MLQLREVDARTRGFLLQRGLLRTHWDPPSAHVLAAVMPDPLCAAAVMEYWPVAPSQALPSCTNQ